MRTEKTNSTKVAGGPPFAIGPMSGASRDGVSAAMVEIRERRRPPARGMAFRTFPCPAPFRSRLPAASSRERAGAQETSTLAFELGELFGKAAIRGRSAPASIFQKLRSSRGGGAPIRSAEASAAERKTPCAIVEEAASARAS